MRQVVSHPTVEMRARFNTLLRDAHLRPIRFHDLRHSTATLLLEQGVEVVIIKELLGHTHIDVTATVSSHVQLQRQAIDLLGHALGSLAEATIGPDDGDDPPLYAAPVRLPSTTAVRHPRGPTGNTSGGASAIVSPKRSRVL